MNKWVSLSEISDKNIDLFHDIIHFLDVPVYIYIYIYTHNNDLSLSLYIYIYIYIYKKCNDAKNVMRFNHQRCTS